MFPNFFESADMSPKSRPVSDQPTAILVEDEPALCQEMRDLLHSLWPELKVVGIAENGLHALRLITDMQPDIAFLDIQIPDPNGLEIARFVGDRCHLVFVTAYDVHAIQAFETGAVDYLLKPLDAERLVLTIRRLKQRLNQSPVDMTWLVEQLKSTQSGSKYLRWVTAIVGHSLRLITIDEVIYFQSDNKYTRVVLADSEVLIKKTLKELLAELDPEQFWQIHRSTVVNALEIAGIEPNFGGQLVGKLKRRREQLPVSESFIQKFRKM